jgi:major type 1 subunit fimbrin (pilin)
VRHPHSRRAAALLLMGVAAPAAALDTLINYSGRITAETCFVQAASNNQTIDMGQFSVADFVRAGDVSPVKRFTVVLERCTGGIRAARVTFSGTLNATDRNLIALTPGTDTAKGLGIELLNANDQRIVPGTVVRQVVGPGTATLNYGLRYRATGTDAGPGRANAVILFDVDYE